MNEGGSCFVCHFFFFCLVLFSMTRTCDILWSLALLIQDCALSFFCLFSPMILHTGPAVGEFEKKALEKEDEGML